MCTAGALEQDKTAGDIKLFPTCNESEHEKLRPRRTVSDMVAMGRIGIRVLVAAVIAVIAPSGLPGNATAAQMATLGGGSGILIEGRAVCTVTTVGYDRAGRMVGLTAGHCADIGMSVQAETQQAGIIGTVAAVGHSNDYAIIEFDRTKVTPVRQVAQTFIGGIGAPPRPGDIVCKNGRTSGFDCGVVWDTHESWFRSQLCSRPGDSGGPVTLGDRLIGMNIGHIGIVVAGVTVFDVACGAAPAVHDPAVAIDIGVILDEMNQSDAVGTGFRPL